MYFDEIALYSVDLDTIFVVTWMHMITCFNSGCNIQTLKQLNLEYTELNTKRVWQQLQRIQICDITGSCITVYDSESFTPYISSFVLQIYSDFIAHRYIYTAPFTLAISANNDVSRDKCATF